MKPLILILLAAIAAEAQALVDVARRERARQTQISGTRLYTNIDASNAVGPPASAGEVIAVDPGSTGGETAAPAQSLPAPVVAAVVPGAVAVADPTQQWNEEVQKARTRIRDLQDQETALQLQVNELNNKFFAPVTTQAARTEAQTKITETQIKATTVQRELAASRTHLQQLEIQGPPREAPTLARP